MLIHEEYTEELINDIKERQKNITDEYTLDQSIDPRAICILDDCLAEAQQWAKDKNIQWIFYNGRHVKLTFIVTMQFSIGIPPKLRNNFQYIFLCRDNRVVEQKKLYANYGSMFPTFEMFKQIHDKYTEDYGCLVINLESTSNDLREMVFWYKAEIDNKPDWNSFKLCCKELWKNNDKIQAYKKKLEDQKDQEQDNFNDSISPKKIKYNAKKKKQKNEEF